MAKKKINTQARNQPRPAEFDPEEYYFIPLGGSEQFGVNLNMYGYDGKWLAVDCGLGFADHRFPGVDLLLPDPTFAADRRDDLVGLIITHAHEDHIGAVAHLWPRLQCPIYCSPFTAAVLMKKLDENPECKKAKVHVIPAGGMAKLGPFSVRFIHMAHSIPDSCALSIQTNAGTVLHSGDWNLDPTPVLGAPTDEAALKEIGAGGVLAYIGDSTNAQVEGRAGSEADVERGLTDLFRECPGRICVTMFASNVGRVHSISHAARATGRSVAVVGRSLFTMTGAARSCGYMNNIPEFVNEADIEDIPDENLVIIVTGSQGEARAALARMARAEHPSVLLKRGDTVIFSARPIPGNETEINEVKNNLIAGGVRVIGPDDTKHKIHVSGHPYRDEIIDMLGWVKPRIVIPVHGERQQLEAHAELARSCQVPDVIVPANGAVIRLGPAKPGIIDHVPTGLLAVEPNRVIAADHAAIASRRKLQFTGAVHVSLVMTDDGELLADPQVTTIGLIDPDNEKDAKLEEDLIAEIEDILDDMEPRDLRDDHAVHEEIRIGVRRMVHMLFGMKPNTSVHVARLEN